MAPATEFFEACRKDDVESIKRMYNEDSSLINSTDARGFTPLILAVYNDAPKVVEFLLEHGADTAACDAAGNTALMGVCFKGYKELARKLLTTEIDVNQRNSNGATALTFAATFGHLQIAKWLLEKGADLSIQDARGKTPLDHAWIQENEAMVDLLQGKTST